MLAGAIAWNSAKDVPAQRENCLKVFEGAWGNFLQKVPPQKEKKHPPQKTTKKDWRKKVFFNFFAYIINEERKTGDSWGEGRPVFCRKKTTDASEGG
jgi:hypothetical protein